jgi:polypeptide N-acetylgalactosaminyltransferase
MATKKCVDSGFKGSGERLELKECKSDDPSVKGEQVNFDISTILLFKYFQDFRLSFWEDIRPKGRTMCFDVSQNHAKSPVTLFACHGMRGNQVNLLFYPKYSRK